MTDGGSSDGGAPPLGSSLFGAPPYKAPSLPIRRLALSVDGDNLCVVLQDRSLYCEASGTSTTARVPSNHDFVSVSAPNTLGAPDYSAVRADGSTATWSQVFETPYDHPLSGASYLGLFADDDRSCGVKSDGSIHCTSPWPEALPSDPFVEIVGTSPTGPYLLGLRVDGVLLANYVGQAHPIAPKLRFVGFDAPALHDGCAITPTGELYCFTAGSLLLQPYKDVRDYSYKYPHICVLDQQGAVSCARVNGDASSSSVPSGKKFVDIATIGESDTCGVTIAGELWCWGDTGDSLTQIPLPMAAAVN